MRAGLHRIAWLLVLTLGLCLPAAQGSTIQYVYDGLGRLVAAIDAAGQTTVYTYDAAGNLLSVTGNAATQLAIAAFTPGSGKAGDSVTLFGSAFVPVPSQNTVTFNGTPAAVVSATATSIVTTVPAGATSGPITVANANGSASSATSFTVLLAPTIAGVAPAAVPPGSITRLLLSGTNLSGVNSVVFAQPGLFVTLASGATATQLPFDLRVLAGVPEGAYPFTVSGPGGSAASGSVVVSVGRVPVGPSLSVARPVSVYLPFHQAPPAGAAMVVAPATSVYLPVSGAPPAGAAMSVAPPVSVSMP